MPIQGDYMGMMLTIEDLDWKNLDFFDIAQEEISGCRKVNPAGY